MDTKIAEGYFTTENKFLVEDENLKFPLVLNFLKLLPGWNKNTIMIFYEMLCHEKTKFSNQHKSYIPNLSKMASHQFRLRK